MTNSYNNERKTNNKGHMMVLCKGPLVTIYSLMDLEGIAHVFILCRYALYQFVAREIGVQG